MSSTAHPADLHNRCVARDDCGRDFADWDDRFLLYVLPLLTILAAAHLVTFLHAWAAPYDLRATISRYAPDQNHSATCATAEKPMRSICGSRPDDGRRHRRRNFERSPEQDAYLEGCAGSRQSQTLAHGTVGMWPQRTTASIVSAAKSAGPNRPCR